jgi:cytochrome c556
MSENDDSIQLIEKLADQVQQLQSVNEKCLLLVKELTQYKAKSETLEIMNIKLRKELESGSTSGDSETEIQKIERECEQQKQRFEDELQEIRQNLSLCNNDSTKTESQFRTKVNQYNERQRKFQMDAEKMKEEFKRQEEVLEEKIEELTKELETSHKMYEQKDVALAEQRERLDNWMKNLSENPIVLELTEDLGAKVDCFWEIIVKLRPFVRQKEATKSTQLSDEAYQKFLLEKVSGCEKHIESYLQELEQQSANIV